MYSLVYGTVPIVRLTGGLADTVENFNPTDETGNGFVFEKYDADEMMKTIKAAISIYKNDQKTWNKIQKAGMKCNFSWLNSSKNYVELYKKLAN
jgi:starch synthase